LLRPRRRKGGFRDHSPGRRFVARRRVAPLARARHRVAARLRDERPRLDGLLVDIPSGTVTKTINLGAAGCARGRGLAISPSGLRLYVGCLLSNNVAVVDTVTESVVTTMPLTEDPFAAADGLAVSPTQPRVYVANFHLLSVYDTTTNSLVTDIPLTFSIGYDQTEGVAVNPAGTRVYVTQVFSSDMNVIDTATNTEIATIPFVASRAVVVDPTGNTVYAGGSSSGGTDVSVIDATTNAVVDTISAGGSCGSIAGLALHPSGSTLYAACRNYVAVIDVATKVVTPVAVGFNVFGVDVSRDGSKVVAVIEGDNAVQIIDTATNTASPEITVGTQPFSYPGLFIGPSFTCGNFIREPGETCDGTTCCTPSCTADTGAACSDSDLCTTGDACDATAACVGAAVDCNDADNCTNDACNPLDGSCDHVKTPQALSADDGGCVAPDKYVGKCEDGVTKLASTLAQALHKCHLKASGDGLKLKPFDETACKNAALGKYDEKFAKLKLCPACIDAAAIRAAVAHQANDLDTAVAYCDSSSGTPLDGGYLPSDKPTAKCEDGALKALVKLGASVVKCHVKLADQRFKNAPYDEEACETTAFGKFETARLKLTACPSCLASVLSGLGASTISRLDGELARTYCAF
jgi:YVTN family beta-propeller protein